MKAVSLLSLFLCAVSAHSQVLFDRSARFHPVIAPAGQGMVVSQEYVASAVGARILASGGNAVDAAVATGFALAVTFPQAGNLGGGGFMLVYLAGSDQAHALDYREVAPARASADMFLAEDGRVDTQRKRFGVDSAAVPGTVAGLLYALDRWGVLSRKEVLAPAIRLASEGIVVSDSLAYSLRRAAPRFQTPETRQYFLRDGESGYQTGDLWVQKDLAATLERISEQGREGFYTGVTAEMMLDQVNRLGGLLTSEDLQTYQPLVRKPVVGDYREYTVVSMPPPSSGGVHLIQMLNILEHADFQGIEHNSADYIHLLAESMKLAYADRSLHLGDPDFFPVPVEQLTSPDYANRLWAGIDPKKARPASDILPVNFAPEESADTTHYSVWDAEGNVVSNTYTLNFSYGNGIAVAGAGFLLNNEMDDFSAREGDANAYGLVGGLANAIEPGKRPLSSMTPTIVFREGDPVLATGSPGGSTIISSVLQSVLNMAEFDMNVAESAAAPRFHHQWNPDTIFWENGISADTRNILEARGHSVSDTSRVFGKLELIQMRQGFLEGAADPRWPGGGAGVEPSSD